MMGLLSDIKDNVLAMNVAMAIYKLNYQEVITAV